MNLVAFTHEFDACVGHARFTASNLADNYSAAEIARLNAEYDKELAKQKDKDNKSVQDAVAEKVLRLYG